MFCNKCGTQLPDGSKFCSTCGNNLAVEAAKPVEMPAAEINVFEAFPSVMPVAETPVAETPAPVAPAVETPAPAAPVFEAPVFENPAPEAPAAEAPAAEAQPEFAQPEFAQPWQAPAPEAPKKKSKKFLAWLIPTAALLVAMVVMVLGATFEWFDPLGLKGFYLKNMGSAEDYRNYVQSNTTKTATGTVTKAYGAVVNSLSGEAAKDAETGAAEMSLKLSVGDKAIELLEDMTESELGQPISMDWARDIELKLDANSKDSLTQVAAKLNISGHEIAVLDSILDMDQGMLFLAALNLSEDYLAVDLSEYVDLEGTAELQELMEDPELIAALPTEKELNDLLNKYIGIAIASLDDVEKSTETVKVGKVKQKLTVLDTTIDGDALLSAAEAVLEELSKDKDVEKILRRVLEYLEDQDAIDLYIDADDVCDEFFDAIDEALESLEDVDGDDMDGEIILTQYVNDAHEMVGCALEAMEEQVLYFVEVQDGDKIAFELKIPNALEIVGEGTDKKGVVNADYTISIYNGEFDYDTYEYTYEKMDVLTVSLVDFQVEGELVNGKIRIAPTSDLLDQAGLSSAAASAIDLAQIQLELGFTTTEKSSTVEFNVLAGEDLLVGVALSASAKASSDIELPDSAYDISDIETWAKDIDTEKILQTLEDAGLPVEEVTQLIFGASVGSDTVTYY